MKVSSAVRNLVGKGKRVIAPRHKLSGLGEGTGATNDAGRSAQRRMRKFLVVRSEGGAVVELAVLLPLLMFILTGFSFLALAMDNYMILIHANDVGARYLSVGRGQLTDPCAQTITVIKQAAPGLASGNLSYTFYIGSSGALGTSCTSAASTNLTVGATATVNVTYTYQMFIFGSRPRTWTMTSSTSEIVQ